MTEFIKHFILSAQCKSVVTFLAKLRFLWLPYSLFGTSGLNEFPFFRGAPSRSIKKKSQVLLFLGSFIFFFLFFLVKKKM